MYIYVYIYTERERKREREIEREREQILGNLLYGCQVALFGKYQFLKSQLATRFAMYNTSSADI